MTKYAEYKKKYLELRCILINRQSGYEGKQLRLLQEMLLESQVDTTLVQKELIQNKINEMQYNQGTIDELKFIIDNFLRTE